MQVFSIMRVKCFGRLRQIFQNDAMVAVLLLPHFSVLVPVILVSCYVILKYSLSIHHTSYKILPSYEVNVESCQPEGGCFPGDLSRAKTTSRGLTTWCSPHMKAITVVLHRNYSKMFMTWMFCFAEDNKIVSGIDNTITEPDSIKTDFQHTSGCHEL